MVVMRSNKQTSAHTFSNPLLMKHKTVIICNSEIKQSRFTRNLKVKSMFFSCGFKSLAKLREGRMLYPQDMKNVRVKDKDAVIADEKVAEALKAVEAKIDGRGRALLRKSGTEPVIRVMVEAETKELCDEYIDEITSVIIERGHKVD